MMRKFLCAVLLLALSACASLAASLDDLKYLNGELRVGMECAYAPNNWQEAVKSDTNIAIANVPGAYAEGYDVQFAAIIAKHLNLKPIIIKMDWDGLIEALNQGQIDVIIAGMMDTAERRQAINFSKPYHSTIYSMMLNKGSKFENATSIQDFKGASVLGQKDTALDTVIDQIEGVNHLAAVASVPDMIARLREGACDAIVINLENSKGYLASNPDFRLVVFEEGKGFKLPAVGSCVGIRKSDNALLELVDEALATVDQDAREVMWETAVNKQPK
ncbi:MAG: transporter substrate-binding domain-containing protein [Synergistaceae bacterium]|nr:transporter substrate-binding domain-containing protein [Synergistaceae bacterium]MBQ9896778.1 transporter substrate-binding domain-containing protein [Synergistaceae bacterium]